MPVCGTLDGDCPQPASSPSASAALNRTEIAFFMVDPPFVSMVKRLPAILASLDKSRIRVPFSAYSLAVLHINFNF